MTSATGELDTAQPSHSGRREKVALVAAKLLVTAACFWYVARQVDLREVFAAVPSMRWSWAAFAVAVAMLQIPLAALRWREILIALAANEQQLTRSRMIRLSAISQFCGQVLPTIAGEGVRAWFLVRLGCDWRLAVSSIVVDRTIGVGLLAVFGFLVLLWPSGLIALGEHRSALLMGYAALLLCGVGIILFLPMLAEPLRRWRYSRWLATLAGDLHSVLLGPRAAIILALAAFIHALTIVIVWALGRAQGLDLPVTDAAVLFIAMVGVVLLPISVSGWGLREVAVVSLLGSHGVAPEKALLFSVCFGLVLAVASVPGAIALLFHSTAPIRAAADRTRH